MNECIDACHDDDGDVDTNMGDTRCDGTGFENGICELTMQPGQPCPPQCS